MNSSHPPSATPWIALSTGLIGFILGYAAASVVHLYLPNAMGVVLPGPVPAAPSVPTKNPPQAAAPNEKPASAADGIVLGSASAPVTIIEFSDFQCPFCRKWYRETYKQIKTQYVETGKVKLVYRHYPLPMHAGAQPSAVAVKCAQEVFDDATAWKLHDAIFENQDAKGGPQGTFAYGAPEISQWAAAIPGFDVAKWQPCMDEKQTAAAVAKDMSDGQASGVSGTPSFWMLGPKGKSQKLVGAASFASFQTAIEAMLKP